MDESKVNAESGTGLVVARSYFPFRIKSTLWERRGEAPTILVADPKSAVRSAQLFDQVLGVEAFRGAGLHDLR